MIVDMVEMAALLRGQAAEISDSQRDARLAGSTSQQAFIEVTPEQLLMFADGLDLLAQGRKE